ncbi:ribonuclease H-like domain-containing protein [Rhizophagus clarus]|uniref:Ribonuclease H-like domain-containing protein n=1 Tax=Rhizophagus clarus TaxID=94130 RepID=A0A8H3KWT0_9GLOM|nr:ribonuclease H-like domain-containing protein [Rhizophagus clarus]
MNIIWNGISHIDKNICKWCATPISAKNFNRLIGSSTYKAVSDLISAKIIDWEATTFWLNYNPHSSPTSSKLSKILSHQIKVVTFMLPTGSLQQRNYPKLYPTSPILCPSYRIHEDTNRHLGLCTSHQSSCITIMESHHLFLIDILTQHCITSSPVDISHNVNSCRIFQLLHYFTTYRTLSPDHPIYLLFYNYVPLELTDLFHTFINKTKLRKSLLLKFLLSLFKDFKQKIWNVHTSSLKVWESTTFKITSKSKKTYRSKFGRRSQKSPRQHVHTSNIIRYNQTRQPLDFGPPMTSRTYHHPNVNYAQHLIWAFSNFLYSGLWHHYLSYIPFDNFNYIDQFPFTSLYLSYHLFSSFYLLHTFLPKEHTSLPVVPLYLNHTANDAPEIYDLLPEDIQNHMNLAKLKLYAPDLPQTL